MSVSHKLEMNFCRRCGERLQNVDKHVYTCTNQHTIFANPSPSVGIFFVQPDNSHVLLSVRGEDPHKGMLDAFGGILDDEDESLESAAIRELREELVLEPEDYEPLRYLTSASTPYEYQDETYRLVSSLFWTRLKTQKNLQPSDDVAATESHPLHELDPALLHSDDIRHGIQELRKLFPKQS